MEIRYGCTIKKAFTGLNGNLPPKDKDVSSTPELTNRTSFWRRDLCIGNWVEDLKMRSFKILCVGPKSNDKCP